MRALGLCALLFAGCFDFEALRAAPDLAVAPPDGGTDLTVPDDLPAVDSGPDVDSGVYAFVPAFPPHQSLYYGGHDLPPATVNFTHAADAVACSHDGGKSYAPCDGPHSIVFSPDDYTLHRTLAIKLSKAGYPDFVYTFVPSVAMPGLAFYNCTQVVTQDESTSAFAARLAANAVICLNGTLTIRDAASHVTDGGIHIDPTGIFLAGNSTGLKILGTEINRPLFLNPDYVGNQGVFIGMSAALHDAVFANLRLQSADGNPISFETNGGFNAFSYVEVRVTAGCCDQAVTFGGGVNNLLHNVVIDTRGSGGTVSLHLFGSAMVSYTGGQILGRDDKEAILLESSSLTLTNVMVDNAAFSGNTTRQPAISLVGASSLTMTGGGASSVIGTGLEVATTSAASVSGATLFGDVAGVSASGGSTVALNNVTVTTDGVGIKLNGSTLALDHTTVERLDKTGTVGPAVDLVGVNNWNSSANGNHFCDQNKTGSNVFNAAITKEAGGSYSGTFDPLKQVNQSMLDQCP